MSLGNSSANPSSLNNTFSENSVPARSVFMESVQKTTAYVILFVISFLGNTFIIRTIYKDNRLKTTINFLAANMAVSDLISTMLIIPTSILRIYIGQEWLIDGIFGEVTCKTVYFIADTSTAVSFYSCVFIAIDRYFAVVHPLKGGFCKSRLKYIIPGIWIFSALTVSPYFYSFKVTKMFGKSYCSAWNLSFMRVHFYVLAVIILGIPLVIIATLYTIIVVKLHRHKTPGVQIADIARQRREKQNNKVLKMSIAIISLLAVCWGYFFILVTLTFESGLREMDYDSQKRIGFSAFFVAHSSFTHNFFIYLFFNDMYRENFKAVISKWCMLWRYL